MSRQYHKKRKAEERRAKMIKTVIRVQNGMVMVFDERGEQMPEYQGRYDEVREMILANAAAGSVFNHWFGVSPEPERVPARFW
jgi:hypothetical protein